VAGQRTSADRLHVPAPLAVLLILGEPFGPILLALGLLLRMAAFGISAIMIGAILILPLPHGFFMNWCGAQQGEGFEFHLLALALSVPIMIRGGGRFALDSVLATTLPSAHASGWPRRVEIVENQACLRTKPAIAAITRRSTSSCDSPAAASAVFVTASE
jgi:uncharacterized membrane protein YphA (DoxX/SURF4 family)